jgi:hypothetical protein
MRGSAGSYGIATSIKVKTFPAPLSATVFQYSWDLSATDASNGIAAFQSFVQTNIPPEFGAEINLGKGSASGKVSFTIIGGWYGPASGLNTTIAALLAKLPKNPLTSLNVGTYINSVKVLAGNQLNTTKAPDVHDTFYAKSIMTPAGLPMSPAAIKAFMNYLAHEGFSSMTVGVIILEDGISCNSDSFCSNGFVKWSSTEARTLQSMLLRQMPRPSCTEARSLPFSFTLHLQTRYHLIHNLV